MMMRFGANWIQTGEGIGHFKTHAAEACAVGLGGIIQVTMKYAHVG